MGEDGESKHRGDDGGGERKRGRQVLAAPEEPSPLNMMKSRAITKKLTGLMAP